MSKILAESDQVQFGDDFSISFRRTLRIPEDGKVYPLPPDLGALPVHGVEHYRDRVPAKWLNSGGVFIPLYQSEAMWLAFHASESAPKAVKIGVGRINAISGEPWDEVLYDNPQDYIVCPYQPWLDGVNTSEGVIRQFVAMPLGLGYTIEGQLTGKEEFGGIQILVYGAKPGRFLRPISTQSSQLTSDIYTETVPGQMGIAAGGEIRQKIYIDPFGRDNWDTSMRNCLCVHIVNSYDYCQLTESTPPPTPISPKVYAAYGFPWFSLYDEERPNIPPSEKLGKVISTKKMENGTANNEVEPIIDISDSQVIKLMPPEPDDRVREKPRRNIIDSTNKSSSE